MQRNVLGLITMILGTTASVCGQTASALVREGEPLPGGVPGDLVNSINNTATNHVGGYAVNVNTSDGVNTLGRIWGANEGAPGAIIRSEDTFGALVQTSYESFYGIGNHMEVAYSAIGTGGAAGGFDSVWLNDAPIAVEGDPVLTIAGQFWSFGSRPGVTADGKPYWVGGITGTVGGTTQNRGLFFNASQDVLLLGGDLVPGLPAALSSSGTTVSFDYRFSALASNYIAEVQMTGISTTMDTAMVVNGAGLMAGGALVQEGTLVPPAIGGLAGENWASFDFAGITELGHYFFTGDTSGATATDEFIVVDGMITYREGDIVDGRALTSSIQGAYMNESGDLAYVWAVDDDGVARNALFLNDHFLLMETDTVDLDGDGAREPNSVLANFTGISALTVSARDVSGNVQLYFTADIDVNGTPSTTDDIEGFFCLTVAAGPSCPTDLNYDGVTDLVDLAVLLGNYGLADPGLVRTDGDLDGDNVIGLGDVAIMLAAFGTSCP